jgi:DNA-binding transcriptional LysR family regulator
MLNTFHLRTFLAVVDHGSYSAAAKSLHMSQPAVSQQIHALEEQLGDVRLFRRIGQRMVPTHAGEELLRSARDLVGLAERVEQDMLALRGQVTGQVNLGCTPNSGERLLPALLALYHQQYPSVGLSLLIDNHDRLVEALSERSIDLMLSEELFRRRGFETAALGSEALILVAQEQNPVLSPDHPPLDTLRDQPFILPRHGEALRRSIDEGLRRRGMAGDLRVVLETSSISALIEAIRHDIGLAFIPQSYLPIASIAPVPLAGPPLHQDWVAIRLRERSIPRPAQSFFDLLTGRAAQVELLRLGMEPTIP